MNIIYLFSILTVVNVILSTVRSLCTIKCSKYVASLVNAISYGFYTIVIVYTNCDGINLLGKASITALANLIGVFVVKTIEEKMRKDKLWKIEFSVKNYGSVADALHHALDTEDISHNYINIGKYTIFNCYCPTQKESQIVKKYINEVGAKYFASEAKIL